MNSNKSNIEIVIQLGTEINANFVMTEHHFECYIAVQTPRKYLLHRRM